MIRQGVPHGSKEHEAEVVEVTVDREEHDTQGVASATWKEDGGETGAERSSEICRPVLA